MRKKWKNMFMVNLAIFLSVGALNVQANDEMEIRSYPEWKEVYEKYLEDEMFLMHLEDDSESALSMIDTIVKAKFRNATYAGTMKEPKCIVPLIIQKEVCYYGGSSALQACTKLQMSLMDL